MLQARVSRLRVSIVIAKPRREVYEFLAKPRLRRRWLTERVQIAGREARIQWRMTAREAPRRCVMRARFSLGEAELHVSLAPDAKGTLCECEIAYQGVSGLLDLLHVQPRLRREAGRSLEALKQALESSGCTPRRAASG